MRPETVLRTAFRSRALRCGTNPIAAYPLRLSVVCYGEPVSTASVVGLDPMLAILPQRHGIWLHHHGA
jgi:hypothetical protein